MKDTKDVNEALRSLYERHAHDIYRYAKLMLGDDSIAADVVQEVFLRAFRSWRKFRNNASPKTWLFSIARNHIFDLLKRRRSEHRIIVDSRDAEMVVDNSSSVETRMMLEEALSKLKETYRNVFILRHVNHYSVEETAQIMGWTKGNVKTTDRRAIAKMREILNLSSQEVNHS